ncbi:MAG TPA: FIST N-terminal domain-containing protein [Gammaproteobacteria bacterium]|nr:FIST N-terminal domain-containing protein [Gammaproteobacteria bacterium]
MQVETFNYTEEKGWSVPSFPLLDSSNTLILIFAAPQFIENPKPILELIKAYPKAKITGCSSAGEIFGPVVNDNSLSVAVTKFDHTTVKIESMSNNKSEASYAAGSTLAKKLLGEDLKSILVLSDGLTVNGTELVKGFNDALPAHVVVTGGLAGDGSAFKRTWVIYNGSLLENAICAIGLYGKKLTVGHGSKGGWDTFGPERRITRATGNVLYELDGKPALALYKEYLGDRAKDLPASGLLFPLMIREEANSEKQLVRTILAVDEDKQSLTFAGDIPMGHFAKLMRANFDRLVTGANDAAVLAASNIAGKGPTLAIAISCVGRRLLLGERIEEETEATLEILPKGTAQVGFYSYGELSPYATGACDLHNQTMTLTTYAEQ